jgi:hypothetical protein
MSKESKFMVVGNVHHQTSGSISDDDFWLAVGDGAVIPYWPETQGDIDYWTEVQRIRLQEIKERRGLV